MILIYSVNDICNQIICGDVINVIPNLPQKRYYTCVTSPPYYGLRDYGVKPTKWPQILYSPITGIQPIIIDEWEGCLGLEPNVQMYIAHIVYIFRQIKNSLKDDGTLWLNLGDSYAGSNQGAGTKNPTPKQASNRGTNFMTTLEHKSNLAKQKGYKAKDLLGVPWLAALALQADGWYLRQDIIWSKNNAMPESVKDRCTKSHEYIFLFSKSPKYYFDHLAIQENCVNGDPTSPRGSRGTFTPNGGRRGSGNKERKQRPSSDTMQKGNQAGSIPWEPKEKRNKRSVWIVNIKPCRYAHFATFPPDLIEPCILAGCPEGEYVIDPFMGSGTTGMVAKKHNRNYTGVDIQPEYISIQQRRIEETA